MDKEALLYRYFSNSLSEDEEKQFQELLQTDTDFKEQFEFAQNLKRVIKTKENVNLKAKLKAFENDIEKSPTSSKPKGGFRNWSIAASIALLMGLGWIGYNMMSGPNYDNLYNDNFQEYPNTVFAITRGDAGESIERDAFAAYEAGDYQTAINNFNAIPVGDKKEYLDFYLGQSHLNLYQYQDAKRLFKIVITSKSEFKAEAYWYLALIAIKEKDKVGATNYLKELTSKFGYNKEKALQLLQDLE